MKQKLKLLGKNILILLLSAVTGTLLLTLAFMMPVNEENRQASYQILSEEGWYPAFPMMKMSLDTYFHSYLPGVLDDSTDSIMIYTAADTGAGKPLLRAMSMYNDYQKMNYSYYWHGYVSILRPILAVMDYGDWRILNGWIQMFLVFFMAHVVWKKKGLPFALLLFTSYILLMPAAVSLSLQYTWVFYIAAAGGLVLAGKCAFWEEKSRYLTFFMVLGLLTSYFDLLTYPLFTWGFPLVWLILLSEQEKGSLARVKQVVFSGIWWIVGYGGMWVLKWLFATMVTGRNIFEEAWAEVFLRAGVEEGKAYGLMQRLDALYTNWKHYEYMTYMIILLAWFLWIVIRSLKHGWRTSPKNAALLLIGASSAVWYFVMANHTEGHHFFTYRIWGVSILAVLAILLQSVYTSLEKREKNIVFIKDRRISVIGWAVCLVLSVLLTLTAREEIMALNGSAECRQVELKENASIRTSFVPTFSRITKLGLAMESESITGWYELTLWQDGQMLYQEEIPVEKDNDAAYREIPVDWKLKKGREYELEISAKDMNDTVYALITIPGLLPLNELRNLTVDGAAEEGQPIMGLLYRALPTSRKTLLFLVCSWMACAAAVMVTGYSCIMEKKGKEKGRS